MSQNHSTSHLHSEEATAKAQATRLATKALGLPTLRQAINAKCKDCIYDPLSGLGSWRQQVGGCTSTDCPLWPIRPVAKPKADASQ